MALVIEFEVQDKATEATKRLQRELTDLKPKITDTEKGFLGLNSSMLRFASGIASVAGAINISKSIIANVDSMAKLNSQIKLVTDSNEELIDTQKKLYELSKETRSGLDGTTNLYARLARATKDLGTSQEDVLAFTKVISKSLIISGASASETNSAMLQLGQAMSSGVLRGDEFNSIAENGSKIMDVLAKSLKVGRGELRSMAADGKLTSEVLLGGMLEGVTEVDEEFGNMNVTIGQSTQVLDNATMKLSEVADDFIGISEKLSDANMSFASIIDTISNAIQSTSDARAFADAEERIEKINQLMIDMPIQSRKGFRVLNAEVMELAETLGYVEKNQSDVGEITVSKVKEDKDKDKLGRDLNAHVKAYEEYIKTLEETRQKYIDITGTEYDKWAQNTSNILMELAAAGTLTNEELQKVYDTLSQERDIKLGIENIDDTLSGMESMLDMQIQLAESGMNWSESFSGVTGEIANIGKAYKKIDVDKLKYEKADIKLQKDYAKSWLKATGDIEKQKEIEAQFDEDQSKINKTRQSAEIAGYGALAGAMSQAFAEGSTAAKAFQGIQATLGIVNGFTAIAGAWASAPFPANIPAVVATSAQMIPLIGQLTSLGGSGGSGGGGGANVGVTSGTVRNEDYYDNALEVAEETNKPILAKFDRQIELLEQISGYGGTAIGLELEKALAEYKAESTIAIIEASSEGTASQMNFYGQSWYQPLHNALNVGTQNIINTLGEFADNVDYWVKYTWAGDYVNRYQSWTGIDETSFSGASEFIDMLEYMKNNNLLETFGYTQLEYENIISDFQDISTELAVTVLENINTLLDYSSELETLFDEITNTTTYETRNLQKAYEDVSLLAGNQSLADYLQGQIDAITTLEDSLTKSQISLLLSSDVDDYVAQQELIQSIQSSTLETLDSGVLEALNYKDSIMLVADAMAESAKELAKFEETMLGMIENIDDTITSIRTSGMTQIELTQDEIRRLNYTQRAFEVALADSDTDSAEDLLSEITSLSSSISRSAFGDVTDLNRNLISSLEDTKSLIDFEDEIISVHIVGSDLTEPINSVVTSPSVTVANPTNDSERLDNLEAIMTQLLINNRNMYDTLLRLENDGIKTI